jgi:hypothetical protein
VHAASTPSLRTTYEPQNLQMLPSSAAEEGLAWHYRSWMGIASNSGVTHAHYQ